MPTILIPMDGSDCAKRALEHGLTLAARDPSLSITLLNVQQPTLYASLLEGISPELPMQQLLIEQSDATLQTAIERVQAEGVKCSPLTKLGKPAHLICEFAAQPNCLRVVMGTHGRDSLARIILGSVAYQVLAQSPVPVTLIK